MLGSPPSPFLPPLSPEIATIIILIAAVIETHPSMTAADRPMPTSLLHRPPPTHQRIVSNGKVEVFNATAAAHGRRAGAVAHTSRDDVRGLDIATQTHLRESSAIIDDHGGVEVGPPHSAAQLPPLGETIGRARSASSGPAARQDG